MDKRYTVNVSKPLSFTLFLILSLFSLCAWTINNPDLEDGEFLPPEEAFILTVDPLTQKSNDTHLHFKVLPGYQLYHEHLAFRHLTGGVLPQKAITLPTPLIKKDPLVGEYKIYKEQVNLTVSLPVTKEARGLRIQYQGCAEGGFCYPPIAKQVIFSKEGVPTITDLSSSQFKLITNADSSSSTTAIANEKEMESESERISALLSGKNTPLTLLTFLGLGILLAFTPCVLPMVPILANILVGHKPLIRKRSFILAGLYVLSMAICYAIAGVAAGLLGSHLSTTLQQPVFLMALSIFIFMFALSQLNIIHIKFPRIFNKLFHRLETTQHKEGSLLGAITMGAVSALIASPCVTAPLVGALAYIGDKGDALLGGLALFTLAIGMGLPLLIAACIGSHFLPKVGSWMVHVKNVTGVLLLTLAIYIFMRAVPSFHSADSQIAKLNTPFTLIQSTSELSKAIIGARALNKPVILDVYADWCVSCQQMDKEVFEDKTVLNSLGKASLLRLDLTQQTKDSEKLQKELNIIGPPMVLFFWPDGQEAKSYRLAGTQKSKRFIEVVNHFLEKSTARRAEEAQ
jgi:thiol:disulfide interchange protein DsbD